ncbi:TonB-dependent receptor plug domain-containing protein [Chryseobacterium oryctis]|uniref:TonB-dependent receptor plug domain-containing protein n=1 Tax=Chryseobacterium oryctis TaxID=2952618 RepID=A0ABT3HRZ7_9FLAO|nr:TonB-dependent receptor plug domain-containing protein [Chryseobacterium oryctis]MCW3162541.1 TonB-dependent receptor plug domain-containing protein [Chryseobacterium oryctis]
MNFRFTYIILFGLLLFINPTKAQKILQDFRKEKVYVQTNHVFYKPGDEMYYKIYVVQGENNLPTQESRVVNFELIEPSGSIFKKLKYEIKNGYSEGFFSFDKDMKGGIYKIRAYTHWMQNEEGKNAFEKEITLQKIVSPRILMKLDFPKKGYGAGDEVIADFSMKSLSNLPIPFYEAEYTIMHHGEKIVDGKLITDKEGKNQLNFRLPDVLKSSDGLLNIKVNFDGFTESISRNIPIVLNNLDMKFMPEGGTFINGLEQNIAFKIVDEFEKPVDASLEIYNQNHKKITEATAYNFGMGSFTIIPQIGETYYAKIIKPENIKSIYPLPIAKNEGVVFNVIKKNKKLRLKIVSTDPKNVLIKSSFRDKDVYEETVSLKKGDNEIEINEDNLPIGIYRFTILENNIPLAERIVFSNEDKQLKIKITPSKKNYLPREKAIVNIETTDENNKPISANLGMSVIDDKLWTYADDKQNHIISWLLMDSELKGKIERPQFYFDKKEEKASKSLDLVMLTNGYRYFELLPEIINSRKYKYLPEKKNPIYGIIEDENGKPVKAEVYLVEEGIQNQKILKQTTTENGLFYFSDLEKYTHYKVIAKSFKPKHKVKIRLLSYKLNINPLVKQKLNNIDVEEIIKEADIKEKPNEKKYTTDNFFYKKGGKKSDTVSKETNIEQVVVLGYGLQRKEETTSSVTTVKNYEIQNQSLSSLLSGKVAGIEVSSISNERNTNILIRGISSVSNKKPLFVVDGVLVENFDTSINPNDINSITVLKDAAATSIYGSRGVNGVVIINSLKNNVAQTKIDISPKSQFAVLAVPRDSLTQYSYSRQFSYPVYETTNTAHRFDYREAIYWNPVVQTDKNGKAKIEFYNSDANTTFRILTEGISVNGLVGRDETTYSAQSLIAIDTKIPQYVTRADEMHIPVVIKNNSSQTRRMTMDVIVPNRVKLIEFDSIISLKPLESGRLWVKMQTNEVVNSNIQFVVKSDDFRESMILPFKVEEKGFPYRFSIINNKEENIKIEIPEFIDGSFKSSYYVFENRALQMFEDLERLKREPYGCFEQLSSTVYPNIFILDYLKSVRKIDNETEKTVLKNLKKGFEKMLSYKHEDGGFGYFSATQSNVAVSAFALLEFNDLKKYVNIDTKIIQKLHSFILSKKGKNGLFEVRRDYEINQPYSEYSWSRNMYVLYALSKVGVNPELSDSYDVMLRKALSTKDSYQLALMANVSANLGKNKEYDIILSLLNKQYEDKKLKTGVTFTGSGGFSANAETLSLYMMALQKDEKLNQLKIAEVANELIQMNGYYGYGSTQATSLALESLSRFFKQNEKLFGNDKPMIKINGSDVFPSMSIASAYKTGENKINVSYIHKKGLPYKLDYEYYTLKAPKSTDIPLTMDLRLKFSRAKVGETNRLVLTIKNKENTQLPMTTAKIGIPAGLTLQNALLKDLIDKKQVSYYEIFDNYLVLYWEHFGANETKVINLDLKVEFAGEYTSKASNVYLYYMPESKFWNEGIRVNIEP